jgi:hypothetical protein
MTRTKVYAEDGMIKLSLKCTNGTVASMCFSPPEARELANILAKAIKAADWQTTEILVEQRERK